jgi:hypothetical protein
MGVRYDTAYQICIFNDTKLVEILRSYSMQDYKMWHPKYNSME